MIRNARKPQWLAIQMLGLTALSTSALMVHAAPGSLGQVGASEVIFQEDSDNLAVVASLADQANMITDYVSASKREDGNFM